MGRRHAHPRILAGAEREDLTLHSLPAARDFSSVPNTSFPPICSVVCLSFSPTHYTIVILSKIHRSSIVTLSGAHLSLSFFFHVSHLFFSSIFVLAGSQIRSIDITLSHRLQQESLFYIHLPIVSNTVANCLEPVRTPRQSTNHPLSAEGFRLEQRYSYGFDLANKQ